MNTKIECGMAGSVSVSAERYANTVRVCITDAPFDFAKAEYRSDAEINNAIRDAVERGLGCRVEAPFTCRWDHVSASEAFQAVMVRR